MSEEQHYRLGTLAIHAGQRPDPQTGSIALPIHQTTAYSFKSAEYAAQLFNLEAPGFIYTRLNNPTTGVFETRCAALEGGVGAVATASGQQATFIALMNILGDIRESQKTPDAGPHVVASAAIYGGTVTLFSKSLESLGIRVEFVDARDPQKVAAAIRPCTRAVFIEAVANPSNYILDYEALGEVAHAAGIPLVIDNTVMTPVLFRPLEHGADIVVYSATKFIGGHGTCMGGVVVDGGRFDWMKNPERWPHLTQPDVAYHGVNFCERFGKAAFITRCVTHMLRDYGGVLAPHSSFLFLQGLETLHIRMQRHCENAMALAQWLEANPMVSWVNYPGLESHPSHVLAARYLKNGFGAMLAFGVKGGRQAAEKFVESVQLAIHATNLGDVRTIVTHPASTTHRQLSEAELDAAGVSGDLVRVSVGIEDIADIEEDFEQALKVSSCQ